MSTEQHYRICPFCEATCGLVVETDGDQVVSIRGDEKDTFSEGYLCPKGVALQDFHHDPDRLQSPMIRDGETWREASWDEAFTLIEEKLMPIIQEHGSHAVGIYGGNPSIHNVSLTVYGPILMKSMKTPNLFSASTVDQMPKQVACGGMFGTGLTTPVPDVDRCNFLLIMGANPLESNGSLMTAPNIPERLKKIQERGGRIVVLDPRKTKTAKLADEYHTIIPGTDAYFLSAMLNVLIEEGLCAPEHLKDHAVGFEEVKSLIEPYTPERVSDRCGVDAEVIRVIARDFAASSAACIHARMGTCTQEFGTIASWLPDVIHYATGNLDREGGAMFPLPAYGGGNTKGTPGVGRGMKLGRRKSRVSGYPEVFGEFPAACMAEEIETPGEGQIRAMITVAGNPLLSTTNSEALTRAFGSLDFMLSLDVYMNETTRMADVILPGLSPLEIPHFDTAFTQLAIQNHASYSKPVFAKPDDRPYEWETLLRLVGMINGMGANADIAAVDDFVTSMAVSREIQLETSPIHGREADEIMAALAPRRGVERMIDFMVRTGPYGEGFGSDPDGLTLDKLEDNPHGISYGALKSRIPEVLRTPSGKIELAPEAVVSDMPRLWEKFKEESNGLVLVGRRHLRSNNSWLHNSERLVKGKSRCTLMMHPDDADAAGVVAGELAEISSRVGSLHVPVEITEDMMPGVVSIPHGWGHDLDGVQLEVARAHAGVNSNVLTDEKALDIPSGNAIMNGIPVEVKAI